jgi:hypothetical protein
MFVQNCWNLAALYPYPEPMSSPIKWTKTLSMNHEKGHFKVFISEHEGKHFYATILYYEKHAAFSMGDENKGHMDFNHMSFYGASEKEALDKLNKWVVQKLPGDYKLT